jgi:hypothetical protein
MGSSRRREFPLASIWRCTWFIKCAEHQSRPKQRITWITRDSHAAECCTIVLKTRTGDLSSLGPRSPALMFTTFRRTAPGSSTLLPLACPEPLPTRHLCPQVLGHHGERCVATTSWNLLSPVLEFDFRMGLTIWELMTISRFHRTEPHLR